MKLINLTPHSIRVADADASIILDVPPSGRVARVETIEYPWADVVFEGASKPIPVVRVLYKLWSPDSPHGLPPARDDAYYLVSSLVLDQSPGRSDLLAPDTGSTALRDAQGQIVAVRRFRRAVQPWRR